MESQNRRTEQITFWWLEAKNVKFVLSVAPEEKFIR